MATEIGFRKPGDLEIDGLRSRPILWFRFSSELTTKKFGLKLYRELILNNVASCSLPGPRTHSELIREIARKSEKQIPIESLSSRLNRPIGLRGRVVFGFPGNYFDQIARNYDGMVWWFSDKGLNMNPVTSADGNVSRFDEFAGKLMFEARPRRLPNGRLPTAEYSRIAIRLDRSGFKPLDHLEGEFRRKLADWNQKHPNRAVHKFSKGLRGAIEVKELFFVRRGIQKRLNRAEYRWKELFGLSPL